MIKFFTPRNRNVHETTVCQLGEEQIEGLKSLGCTEVGSWVEAEVVFVGCCSSCLDHAFSLAETPSVAQVLLVEGRNYVSRRECAERGVKVLHKRHGQRMVMSEDMLRACRSP